MDLERLDQFMCVEIPNAFVFVQHTNGDIIELKISLHKLVTYLQLHGPCGHHNPSLCCMGDGCCMFRNQKEYKFTKKMSNN